MNILIADELPQKSIDLLSKLSNTTLTVKTGLAEDALIKELSEIDVLLVRSQTKVTARVLESAPRLKVVARAGQGYDNIDVNSATRLGVAVMNTPAKNSSAAAEHTIAMMFALAKHIAQAHAEVAQGIWSRSKYVGIELVGKKLGLLGLGNVGREVAWRAQGLKMEVYAYDPYISEDAMKQMGVKKMNLEELITEVDFISLHLLLTDETKKMINAGLFSKMKKGVRLVNCARGGVIDDDALLAALSSGQVAGCALDVFEKEPPPKDSPLLNHPKIITTPHLGASTEEAQEEVIKAICEQLKVFVEEAIIINGINVPQVTRDYMLTMGHYVELAEKLGRFLGQLQTPTAREIQIEFSGEILKQNLSPLVTATLHGFMKSISSESLNFVNAVMKAKECGIKIVEAKNESPTGFVSLIRVSAKYDSGVHSVSGTVFGKDSLRIVLVDEFDIEAEPRGHMLLMTNEDKPGILGAWAGVLGKNSINIARVHLARSKTSDVALSLVNVDTAVSDNALKDLKSLPHVKEVKRINLS